MLNLPVNNCFLYLGTNAGGNVYNDMLHARQTVLVVTPFVSKENVDLLLSKHRQGVNVMLITSTNFEGKNGAKHIYRKLIKQSQHTNVKNRRLRLGGMILGYLLLLLGLSLGWYAELITHDLLLWAYAAIPVSLFLFYLINRIRVYSYSYTPNMPFHVIASPYADKLTSNQIFVHSKIYVIDGTVAYLGTADFTRAGFTSHYETMFRITDNFSVSSIYHEINEIISDKSRLFRDINYIGSRIYEEPMH
ncbi:MAG: phospholipase D family protein [Gammaproteobacteria bacterium]|nr:phospholipase D family protein [Gammaproteobacteria bacterium]MDH5800375.1 phospholipase D family protein [Gammaproteobacteria bacterium]